MLNELGVLLGEEFKKFKEPLLAEAPPDFGGRRGGHDRSLGLSFTSVVELSLGAVSELVRPTSPRSDSVLFWAAVLSFLVRIGNWPNVSSLARYFLKRR